MRIVFSLIFCALFIKSQAQNDKIDWHVKPVLTGFDTFFYYPDNFFVAIKNGKKGLVTKNNKVIMPFEFDQIHPGRNSGIIGANKGNYGSYYFTDGKDYKQIGYKDIELKGNVFIVKKDKKIGAIDENKKIVVPIEYDKYDFKYTEYKIVFSKADGETISIPSRYVSPESIAKKESDNQEKWPGRILFQKEYSWNGQTKEKTGFMGIGGDTIAQAIYDLAFFRGKYAFVSKYKDKWGVIDQNNRIVLDFRYNEVYPEYIDENLIWLAQREGKWGVIRVQDSTEILPFGKYSFIYPLKKRPGYLVKEGTKMGVMDKAGQPIIPVEYDNVQQEKYTAVKLTNNKLSGWWWIKDNLIVPPTYKRLQNMEDSIFIACRDSLFGLVDCKTGKEINKFEYPNLTKKRNYFVGEMKVGKSTMTCLIGRDGKLLLPWDSVKIHVFKDASLWIEKKNGEIIHQTPEGKVLRKYAPKTASIVETDWILDNNSTNKSGKIFYSLDQPGKEIWVEEIGKENDNLRIIKKNGLYGYYDVKEAKWAYEPVLDNAFEFDYDGLAKAKYKGKWGMLKNPNSTK